ncbi:MAG: sigma-54-dependent Fis family transcriptional regulator [Betaproteobacteria bacterium]|nr:sigma-54-dependent Fis family transcriptional regulator [Betaproteobacteria bacterium]
METMAKLSAGDRGFFSRMAQVTYMNPFDPERNRILVQLAGGHADMRGEAALKIVLPEMNARIAHLEQRGFNALPRFAAADQPLMRSLFLYQIYDRYIPELDRVIEEHLRDKDAPVPLAARLITDFTKRGFTESDALHYFACFFQLRRAFRFILGSLVGRSASMQQLRFALWNNVFTNDMRAFDRVLWGRMEDFSTLLLGETGTGKGSAAAAIGRSGYIPFDRAKGRFVASFTQSFIATNLSQFPETLIESELFGHRKGAFTGAVDDHKGLFELCSRHGALFLDEIGEMTVPVQIKLLQVIQDRTFTSVGSHQIKRFAGRVIAATNKSITELRTSGRFRDDLFYRLCSDVITLPTLRQRLEEDRTELERLVGELIVRLTGKDDPHDTDLILETFKRDLPKNYPWPGNVRELEQAVRRVLLTHHYSGDLKMSSAEPHRALAGEIQAGTLNARELLSRYCALLYDRLGTIEDVARRTGLDRRTVKKYVAAAQSGDETR